jgi:protein-S-isoprenylcysteine O-methyltransferase Ste14
MSLPKNHPGVYVPPPLFYAALFLLSLPLQRLFPLAHAFFDSSLAHWLGAGFIAIYLALTLPALLTFWRSRNTLVTIKPARSLQTRGIYSLSRNPMYLGLLLLYMGLSLLKGNGWTLLLLLPLLLILNRYVISREEQYLERAFGEPYRAYKQQVHRWL